MDHRIYTFEEVNTHTADITFFDGNVKRVDMNLFVSSSPEYALFDKHPELMNSGKIDNSKTHIRWDYNISIDSDTLWFEGILVERIEIEDPHIRLAETLQRVRNNNLLTQKDLEAKSNVRQADISKIERGEGNPSIDTISKLASAMGYIYDGDFQKKKETKKAVTPPEQYHKYLNEIKNQGEYTIDDVIDFPQDEQVQLINGIIYSHATPSTSHQDIVSEIEYQMMDYTKKNNGKCKVWQNVSVIFKDDDYDYLIPDLVVVCDKRKYNEKGIIDAPDFVLEVVSPSEGRHDYTVKLAKYKEKGVREYWIIDPSKKKVLVHFFDEDDFPSIYPLNDSIGVNIFNQDLCITLS